jgi:uncharacterized repeat protein (TIGR01451 family)
MAFRLFVLLALSVASTPASAALSFSLRTGDSTTNVQSMPIDSNKCSTSGPRAMYVGGLVANSGATTATNVTATISGLGSGFFLAGGQAAAQTIGSLGAGQSTGAYWFIGYGCTVNATTSVSISFSSSAGITVTSVELTARSAISANAGGNVLSSTLGPGAAVGQTIYFDATYDFGGSSAGDEYFLQPSGGQNFNAGCFRLVGTQVLASNINSIPVGATNQLYFRQVIGQSGNGYDATVRYSFEYECAGTSSTARPYAVQTSGNTNIKYTGNFDGSGSLTISFPGATNPFQISKTSDIGSAPAPGNATVKYTVTVTNPSAYNSRISSISDTLPSGATFIALDPSSNVTAANSSSIPSAGASGTITFQGIQDQSYLIAAGGTVKLIYTVSIPGVQGTYTNSAQAFFGQANTPTASVTFTVTAPPPLVVSKTSAAYSDPTNGTTNPKLIPGGYATYTVTITNPNSYTVSADSIVVVDPTPTNLQLFVGNALGGTGPLLFQNGSPSSGLTFTFSGLNSTTDDIDFSNDGGNTWTYVPSANASGVDPQVTHIRIRPKGDMAPGSSFTLKFQYLIS